MAPTLTFSERSVARKPMTVRLCEHFEDEINVLGFTYQNYSEVKSGILAASPDFGNRHTSW